MTDYKLTWHRNPVTGGYTATDDRLDPPVTYGVSRAADDQPGRQWMLSAAPPGQFRRGFSTKNIAQAAALETRCHLCFRLRPFAAMEDSVNRGWRCRDRQECARVGAARDAELRRMQQELENVPWTGVSIRETDAGPELVFRTDKQNSTVVRGTETDLLRLTLVLLARVKDRVIAELARAGTSEPPSER